jgi:hypothetical protein
LRKALSDKHDSTEFIDDFELVEIELSPELRDEIIKRRLAGIRGKMIRGKNN